MKSQAEKIVRRLRKHGFQAYLVGGCVRDMLMGKRPKDYDVATDARPDEVMQLFQKTLAVGAHFGVIIVRLRGKSYEVATFREEWGYSDGRRPDGVRFSTARADARRRDFTINGLFYDPVHDKVIDYVGGKKDLKAGVIRAIGDPEARFMEDKLRMLRAVRFSSRFGFPIEEETGKAITRHAAMVLDVSAERIKDELIELLLDNAAEGLRAMDRYGLLDVLLPEVSRMKGVQQPPEFHPEGDVYEHTLLMLEKMKRPYSKKIEFVLGVLLHDAGKPHTYKVKERIRFDGHVEKGADMAEKLLRRLRFANETINTVVELVREHMRFMHVKEMRQAKLKRILRMENLDLHLELHRLDCIASHGNTENYRFLKKKKREFQNQQKELKPPRLITGDDLISMGLEPGPRFKQILEALEDAQLEGTVQDREQALQWVKENYGG
ncbi:MAG: CCA tRNA nucleotidyltransferase [bacterium]